MARLFGTDGVRGLANADLTAELALGLAVAAARVMGSDRTGRPRLRAIVGRDPRASGEFLEAAVVAGLASAGVDVTRVQVLPTPGLAWLVADAEADFGVMLSASHNPMPDNGIKFFARGGVKLPDEVEDAIEAELGAAWTRPLGDRVGRVVQDDRAVERYIDHLVASLGSAGALDGLKVVVDAANGAAWRTGPAAFAAQGAEVVAIHDQPDGLTINDHCGSTDLTSLRQTVLDRGADLGVALDGDADRCLAVDADGAVVDGDQILAILALALKRAGRLHLDTVVATVMSNLGFIQAMAAHGVRVDQTKVGDRYVLESMNANHFSLGGEQSGHVIMSQFATTGDGVLTGLHLAAQVVRSGRPLAELAQVMVRLPQVTVNVPKVDRSRVNLDSGVNAAVEAASDRLAGRGRVLLRPSGTEAVVRVMVEAETEAEAKAEADGLVEVVRRRLAL
ncbi:MAG: phosphoglucosamine mutase [Propionibacteriaceae bacterium]|jgi:phosphoglucosamine mutase|nr:phosphoglucosamine mutase [Propionibacteriaceae bacterium]